MSNEHRHAEAAERIPADQLLVLISFVSNVGNYNTQDIPGPDSDSLTLKICRGVDRTKSTAGIAFSVKTEICQESV